MLTYLRTSDEGDIHQPHAVEEIVIKNNASSLVQVDMLKLTGPEQVTHKMHTKTVFNYSQTTRHINMHTH